MKNLTNLSLVVILFLASCKQPAEDVNTSDTEKDNVELTAGSNPQPVYPPCFSSYEIYAETAYVWENSWINYYHEKKKRASLQPLRLYFSEKLLSDAYKQLDSKKEGVKGFLLYYIMTDKNQSIPGLTIVNTLDCVPQFDSPTFYTVYADGSNGQINLVDFTNYTQYWKDAMYKNPETVYTEVYAYNYRWNKIWTLVDSESGDTGMYVTYGLKTLEPGDNDTYNAPAEGKTGSVVYCNILHKATADFAEGGSGSTGEALLDFALPCPTYCD